MDGRGSRHGAATITVAGTSTICRETSRHELSLLRTKRGDSPCAPCTNVRTNLPFASGWIRAAELDVRRIDRAVGELAPHPNAPR
jgi:hypothetical protein